MGRQKFQLGDKVRVKFTAEAMKEKYKGWHNALAEVLGRKTNYPPSHRSQYVVRGLKKGRARIFDSHYLTLVNSNEQET